MFGLADFVEDYLQALKGATCPQDVADNMKCGMRVEDISRQASMIRQRYNVDLPYMPRANRRKQREAIANQLTAIIANSR